MSQPTESEERTEMILALRRIAEELGTPSVSYMQFAQGSAVNWRKVQRLFGSYNSLVEAAGLVPKIPGMVHVYSDEELLGEMMRVLRLPGSKLASSFFARHSRLTAWICSERFGGWLKALKATAEKLDAEQDRDLISRIRAYTARQAVTFRVAEPPPGSTLAVRPTAAEKDLPAAESEVPRLEGNLYGDLIRFRALEHAPVNEQGVVFLFGMICRELGYVVEILKPGFPDCEAKCEVRPGVWRRVRIEFEFRARTFRTHHHDPSQCDVIVCWENNWPNCPIEVQELKSALPRLASGPEAA